MIDCQIWDGCFDGKGYGTVTIGGHQYGAHRVAWERAAGMPVPAGYWVLHRCDNPKCVNPEHLFLGTPKDNIQDCIRKGRRNTPRGAKHANAKLTEAAAARIKALKGKVTATQLAKEYGVSLTVVSLAMNNKTWKHVAPEAAP